MEKSSDPRHCMPDRNHRELLVTKRFLGKSCLNGLEKFIFPEYKSGGRAYRRSFTELPLGNKPPNRTSGISFPTVIRASHLLDTKHRYQAYLPRRRILRLRGTAQECNGPSPFRLHPPEKPAIATPPQGQTDRGVGTRIQAKPGAESVVSAMGGWRSETLPTTRWQRGLARR